MKIDRRSFLALSIGGTVGTTLSPLPWKLQDDVAIWSTMWPWTPWPQDDENTYVNSVSTLCTDGCGITVRKVGERAVKIEGMEGYPTNDGGICNLCAAGLQKLYSPTRILTPLKRMGERGQGQWVRISWDAAIREVAQRLGEIRQDGKPESVMCLSGRREGTMAALLERFMTAYGSPNFIPTSSMMDAYALTLQMMNGVDAQVGFDLEAADFILSFGCGLVEGWGHTVRSIRANSEWTVKNATVKQIEPRLSNTAAKAGQWIPIAPGTEEILALGLAHVIIKESLYDYVFVDKYAHGFEAFRDFVLASYSPGNVSNQTGVDPSTIVSLARDFARAKHPLALCGRGQGAVPGSQGQYVAVHALNALVGNLNRPGGVWALPNADYIEWPESELDATAEAGLRSAALSKVLPANDPEAIQALLVYDENPRFTLPGGDGTRAVLDQIPFIVSFASQMNETAAYADLVLPDLSHLERYDDVPAASGFNLPLIGLAQPVVAPQGDVRHTGDVILQLAAALGGSVSASMPWENYEACLKATLGTKWATMVRDGYWIDERFQPDSWFDAFQTDSGKFEFANAVLDYGKLFAGVKAQGDEGQFTLTLIPYYSVRIASGNVASPPFLVKTISDTILRDPHLFVEVNAESGAQAGFKEGDLATLKTPVGSADVRVHLSTRIGPGLLGIPHGLGHTAYDEFIAGKGVNANDLLAAVEDPVSGLDASWGIRASLTKA
ncbi:MAG: molybdopterin-dependent oxidoreductase [Desulfobacterales bacterium]|nr:molybdopterin-dependent oxidoreductase [Desulfobacterales bacterium]